MPAPLDEIRHKIMQLEIEEQSLNKETDDASKERLAKIVDTKKELVAEEKELKARWDKGKTGNFTYSGLEKRTG